MRFRSKELSELVAKLRENEWDVDLTGGGHLKLTPPDDGRIIYTGSTPGDVRSHRNLLADLRRGRPDAEYLR